MRAAPFPVAELRSDENVLPDAFCAEVRYNVAQDFDSSGYSEPVDGVSQLGFGTIPSRTSPVFGDYGTGVAVHVDQKDNLWTEPHFQVLSFGNERGAVYVFAHHFSLANANDRNSHNPLEKPAPCTPRASQQRTLDLKLGGCKSDPYAMREHWIQVARSSHVNESDVGKVFSKNPKTRVATPNTLRASALRRKHPAKFKCPVNGCLDDFTRKHNLESMYTIRRLVQSSNLSLIDHLRSHCGVTDLICPLCNKGFTTIPVLKRHHRSCARTAASLGSQHSKSFLAMLTAEEREPKLLIS